jgi:protein SCO1/2
MGIRRAAWVVALAALPALVTAPAAAHDPSGDPLADVHFDQKLDAAIPSQLTFYDEAGNPVRLGDYLGQKPLILQLGYYECPMLCDMVFQELAHKLGQVQGLTIGDHFQVLSVSIDPGETPAIAAGEKEKVVAQYGRAGAAAGWHFLTGDEQAIASLADAIGFHYVYDAEKEQYAHPAGVVILTPQGRISRYLYGIDYEPRDVRLGLVQAGENRIGSPVDKLLLLCYQYDAAAGQYTLAIMNVLRLAGLGTTLVLGLSLLYLYRRGRGPASGAPGPQGDPR